MRNWRRAFIVRRRAWNWCERRLGRHRGILKAGMGAATLVSVEDYLSTSYSPDREYIDGRIVERNLGEKAHSSIQANLIMYLGPLRKALGIRIYAAQRVQVSPP